jgi:Cohesin domain
MLLLCGLFSVNSIATGQQISFGLPNLSFVQPGTQVSLPLTAISGFDSVESVQFVVKWDTAVLKFVGVQDFNLPGMALSNFGYSTARPDLLRFAYTNPNLLDKAGVKLPPNKALFSIKFDVVGSINSGTPVVITEDLGFPSTYFELVRTNGSIFNLTKVAIKNGFVAVGYQYTALEELINQHRISIFPNPTSGLVSIRTLSKENLTAHISIYTPEGVQLNKRDYQLVEGAPLQVDVSEFRIASMLYLLIQTDQWSEYVPIVFHKE